MKTLTKRVATSHGFKYVAMSPEEVRDKEERDAGTREVARVIRQMREEIEAKDRKIQLLKIRLKKAGMHH